MSGKLWCDLFYTSDRKIRYKNVSPVCQTQALTGNCDFYRCFERRFPCGRDGYVVNHATYFCDKLKLNTQYFNDEAKAAINASNVCLISHFRSLYQGDSTTCETIKQTGIEAIVECNARNAARPDYCQLVRNNWDGYWRLFSARDMYKLARLSTRVWSSLIVQSFNCGSESLQGAMGSIINQINLLKDYLG
ncbi:hypothetical protein CHS0354_030486 [Potamilus streckersoni]|uniref:Uncharacterized protein n=1 Tax=Potamilus streckersoni TaxID=2493646 RepID=A0AAE0VGX2_9BIVA|nr:hypothetical protein CHS0354_030486 [Potamilus streckersoni]